MRKPQTKIIGFAGNQEPDAKAITRQTVFGNDAPPFAGKQSDTSVKGLLHHYSGTVYSVVKRIADKITSTDCRLYSTSKQANTKSIKQWDRRAKRLQSFRAKYLVTGGDDVTEITSNPASDLLHRPNPQMTGRQLLTYTQLYLDVAGVCYWRLMANGTGAADGQQPDSIYVLPPHLVKKEPGSNAWKYGDEKLQPGELLIIKSENLMNPYGDVAGVSGVRAVLPTLELQDGITATLLAIMENEGRPSGILAPRGEYNGLGEDEAERWRRKYSQFMRGGSGQVMVMESDAVFTPLQYKPTDLAAKELALYAEELICQTYQMPVMIHRGTEGGSRAAYETALQEWADGGLSSRLRDLEDFLNFSFLPRFDESGSLFFCFDDPSPATADQDAQRVISLVQAGLLEYNEGRAMLGMEPTENGDRTIHDVQKFMMAPAAAEPSSDPAADVAPVAPAPTQQEIETNPALTLNGAQIESAVAIVERVATGNLPRNTGLGMLQILLNLSADQAATIMGEVGATFFAPVPGEPEQSGPPVKRLIIPDDHRPSTKAHKPIKPETESPELEKILVKHFKRWAGDIEQSFKHVADNITTKALPKKFIPLDKWEKDLAEDSQPVIEMIYREGAKKMKDRLVQRVGASADVFDVSNAHVAKRARSAALDLAQSTLDTTTKAVNDALDATRESIGEGLEQGESMRKLTDRVKEIFESAEQYRAERIARTESVRASTEGLRDQAIESDVVKGFEWSSSSDPCPLCAELNGKFIKLDGDLPPLHPNCQCNLLEVLKDD